MQKYDLSILILTHKRPELFYRCLESIEKLKLSINYEILVNNDSNDIDFEETKNKKLFNYKSEDISDLYLSLYKESRGKYIYYLEDDDILMKRFKNVIQDMLKIDCDLAYCNFIHHMNILLDIKETKILNFNEFLKNYEHYKFFQLSRVIFKKSKIIKFPRTNNLLNDYILFKNIEPRIFKVYKDSIYKQTTDGKDNISFKEYNKDSRFYESLKEEFYDESRI